VRHVAVEPGGDLLLDGAVEAAANGAFHALFREFGDVAEVDMVVGQRGEGRKLRHLIFGQGREIIDVEAILYELRRFRFHIVAGFLAGNSMMKIHSYDIWHEIAKRVAQQFTQIGLMSASAWL
jgi:hypothetical protein